MDEQPSSVMRNYVEAVLGEPTTDEKDAELWRIKEIFGWLLRRYTVPLNLDDDGNCVASDLPKTIPPLDDDSCIKLIVQHAQHNEEIDMDFWWLALMHWAYPIPELFDDEGFPETFEAFNPVFLQARYEQLLSKQVDEVLSLMVKRHLYSVPALAWIGTCDIIEQQPTQSSPAQSPTHQAQATMTQLKALFDLSRQHHLKRQEDSKLKEALGLTGPSFLCLSQRTRYKIHEIRLLEQAGTISTVCTNAAPPTTRDVLSSDNKLINLLNRSDCSALECLTTLLRLSWLDLAHILLPPCLVSTLSPTSEEWLPDQLNSKIVTHPKFKRAFIQRIQKIPLVILGLWTQWLIRQHHSFLHVCWLSGGNIGSGSFSEPPIGNSRQLTLMQEILTWSNRFQRPTFAEGSSCSSSSSSSSSSLASDNSDSPVSPRRNRGRPVKAFKTEDEMPPRRRGRPRKLKLEEPVVKRGRGRPRKYPVPSTEAFGDGVLPSPPVKRGRGRPRKHNMGFNQASVSREI